MCFSLFHLILLFTVTVSTIIILSQRSFRDEKTKNQRVGWQQHCIQDSSHSEPLLSLASSPFTRSPATLNFQDQSLWTFSKFTVLSAWNVPPFHLSGFCPLPPSHFFIWQILIHPLIVIHLFIQKSFEWYLCTRNREGSNEQEKHRPCFHRM